MFNGNKFFCLSMGIAIASYTMGNPTHAGDLSGDIEISDSVLSGTKGKISGMISANERELEKVAAVIFKQDIEVITKLEQDIKKAHADLPLLEEKIAEIRKIARASRTGSISPALLQQLIDLRNHKTEAELLLYNGEHSLPFAKTELVERIRDLYAHGLDSLKFKSNLVRSYGGLVPSGREFRLSTEGKDLFSKFAKTAAKADASKLATAIGKRLLGPVGAAVTLVETGSLAAQASELKVVHPEKEDYPIAEPADFSAE